MVVNTPVPRIASVSNVIACNSVEDVFVPVLITRRRCAFAQLKRELVYPCQFRTRKEATVRINHYFLTVFNP